MSEVVPTEPTQATLLIPVACSIISIVLFTIHAALTTNSAKRYLAKLRGQPAAEETPPQLVRRQQTGLLLDKIAAWKTARLLACATLTALTVVSVVTIHEGRQTIDARDGDDGNTFGKPNKMYEEHKSHGHWFMNTKRVEILLCTFYAYTTVLAIFAFTLGPKLRAVANFHLVVLLLVALGVYAWRDLFPLATFELHPVDAAGGWLTWTRIGILTLAAAVTPLCIPRPYVPLDPKNPGTPNPEQTASLLSFMLYTYLDSIIWTAYRSPKLEYDHLPALADYDRAEHLRARSFDKIDPLKRKKEHHLFWGLMQVFWGDYAVMAVMITTKALMDFAGPLGIRYLLLYLQNPNEPGYIRPWVWILWLFLGPVVGSIAMQWYIFTATGLLVRTEGILTQLFFEHSLRIRTVAEVTGSDDRMAETLAPTSDPMAFRGASGSEPPVVDDSTTVGGGSKSLSHVAGGSNASRPTESSASLKRDNKQSKVKAKDNKEDSNLVGKINNLMSTDLANITEGRHSLFIILSAPVQIIVSICFLYKILGWSALAGMVTMLLTFPLPGLVARRINRVQTDARVQTITESMGVIRMIKMFGWEKRIKARVEAKREEELLWYKKRQLLGLLNMNLNYILPLLVMLATFAAHTLWFGKPLNASIVFSSTGVFEVLRSQLFMLFRMIPTAIQAKVSLDRADNFLEKTELLDVYTKRDARQITNPSPQLCDKIGFCNATFTWTRRVPGTPSPSRRNFRLRIPGELLFRRGKINMIVGPTGCGKTSLLMALLGEMHFVPSTPDSWFSLPRQGGVAYAAQEAWVQNKTIRENILFGAEYNEERYNQVISQCALERDLTLFDAGDQTEIGEKGMTLSGGQKARVSVARAIYSNAEIIILDDVLSALDVHTSRWIVDHCFRGDLVAGRTVLVVTHNVAMVSEVADFVVSLGTSGHVVSQGGIGEAYKLNPKLKAEADKDRELEHKDEHCINESSSMDGKSWEPAKKSCGKLTVVEEMAEGHVGWPALKLFLLALGGARFWLMYMVGFILAGLAVLLQTYWLGIWARAYEEKKHAGRVDVPFYLGIYGVGCLIGMLLYTGAFIVHVFGSIRASRRIHDQLVEVILAAPLRWLDSTPVGRVVARFTQDMRCVDGSLPNELQSLVDWTILLFTRFFAVVLISPLFTFPGVSILAAGIWIGQVYISAQLSVKREMSNARSPLFSHFGAALHGITTIRAYGAQDQFKNEALKRIDKYTRVARTCYNLNRWVCLRMDAVGGTFAAGLATYLVFYRTSVDASDTGFSLNLAVSFSAGILMWVRILNEFEVQGNSLERIQDYVQIEQEPEAVPEKVPPAYWPASGNIVVENLTARYSKDGPAVLHNISFEIKSGECYEQRESAAAGGRAEPQQTQTRGAASAKGRLLSGARTALPNRERVGVVGRTGSGKSSLTLSLLRMIPIEGNVYYDGQPTHAINLDALRSNITIIPQQPELMSGTVRQNLDPFDEYDDAVLNAALRSAGLDTVQSEEDEGYIGLDSGVSAGGGNFSLGQRQILALARAIVRRSKVLILDEATAAIDYNADTAIQKSIQTELNDLTLVIVAHRLQTVCDADKVMVLEAGKIVEYDSPVALLQKDGGAFRSLVDESGDRDALYAIVKGKQA